MIKKYPWHFIYLIFIIICLANIFQKLKWSIPTDNILWKETEKGLQCLSSPPESQIHPGDILLTVNKYVIHNKIDLFRIIQKGKYSRYEIEREGLLNNVGIDIVNKYTPLSYYVLVFSGILSILLVLNILNADLKQTLDLQSPKILFFLNLSFAGFLIFSPTGDFHLADFIFYSLDRISFLLFPAILLHFAILYPIRSRLLKNIRPKFFKALIYVAPATIFIFYGLFILDNLVYPIPELITLTINHFRTISNHYFSFYLLIAFIFFLISNLIIIFKRRQKRVIFLLISMALSLLTFMAFTVIVPSAQLESSIILNFSLVLLTLLPLSITYYLNPRRYVDIDNIIKRTVSLSSVFLFIFGIFFLLGISIETNKLLGLFWSVTAILTAGLVFKPIEGTVHNYFEKIFFRGSYNFKRKLKTLITSLPTERNLSLLARNFLDTITHGFNLKDSSLLIYSNKNIFYSLPQQNKVLLTKKFRNHLSQNDNLVFYSDNEFSTKFPKDFKVMKALNFKQFFPLMSQDKLTALIAMSLKEDNSYLSLEEWELLFSLSSTLSLSVENASLYSELENQLTELNLLKEFNENIIENLNLGIVVLSRMNIIKTWNVFMEHKMDVPRENAINKKAHSMLGTDLWKKIYAKKKGITFLNNIKIEKAEQELIFDIYISPLKDNLGSVIGTILVFEDVTEKIHMQAQLITTEKMASLGFLSAGIAHEINTPLTGISSYCQFILDNPKDRENPELIAKIQEQVQRANKTIATLLDFSRQKGEQPLELDVNEVINESISLLEHKLKRKNILLEKQFNLKKKLYGFSNRLQQLFINLLINAIDAIDKPEGKIVIRAQETDENIQITISDNGKGIESKELKKIFDPFFTTKAPGEGTGLGLSISYNIVKDHYGDIKVKSKMNQGSQFFVTLPYESPLRRIKI